MAAASIIEVGGHDIWINRITLGQAPIPRHREIKTGTARSLCEQLNVPFPRFR